MARAGTTISKIVVSLPDYAGGVLTDVAGYSFSDGTVAYNRHQISSDGTYEFSLHQLNSYLPDFQLYNLCLSSSQSVAKYIPYTSAGYDLNEACGISLGNCTYSTILMPSSAYNFAIAKGDTVTIKLTLDLPGIILVYDDNTPNDKTDDIVVMTKGWWNRFAISKE
jgi:hypothetical protein